LFSVFGTAEGTDSRAEGFAEAFHEEDGGVVVEKCIFGEILRIIGKGNEGVIFVEGRFESDAETPVARVFEAAVRALAAGNDLLFHREEGLGTRERDATKPGRRVDVAGPKPG